MGLSWSHIDDWLSVTTRGKKTSSKKEKRLKKQVKPRYYLVFALDFKRCLGNL